MAQIHAAALDILDGQGLRIWLPEARNLLAAQGARVEEMVYLPPQLVERALISAPKHFTLKGASERYDVPMALGTLSFHPGSGTPNATDLVRGRRPGRQQDLEELLQITEHFDVLHTLPPNCGGPGYSPRPPASAHDRGYAAHIGQNPPLSTGGEPHKLDCFENDPPLSGLKSGFFSGSAPFLLHHQYQFTAPIGYPHGPGTH